jgi:hypothetical protein
MGETTGRRDRLSPQMRRVLGYMSRGESAWTDCRGRSYHAGRLAAINALKRRGLVRWDDDLEITDAGLAAVGLRRQQPGGMT